MRRTIAVQASPVIVAALGMTVIIIAGGIDLAAGTALALCGHGAGLVPGSAATPLRVAVAGSRSEPAAWRD